MRKLLLLALLAVILPVSALAQRTPLMSPRVQLFDNNGDPLAGGRLWTYVSGTTTPLATYPDANGIGANTNPVILDAAGRADVWLLPRAYKLILEDATCAYHDIYGSCHGNLIWTVDNVTDYGAITVGGTQTVAGDVTGALATTTVAAIQGRTVASTAPTDGQVLTWVDSASAWQPAAPGAGGAAHSLLSATHDDTLAGSVSRGSLLLGNATPKWSVLSLGSSGTVLRSNGSDAVWSSLNLATDVTGALTVAHGGTGLASGTSGGIPYFSAAGTMATSAELGINRLVLGGGAGATPFTLAGLGSSGQVLCADPAGAPDWCDVEISPLEPGQSINVSFANEAGTGTVADKLAKITSDPPVAIRLDTTDTIGAFGICVSGCGTTGNAIIAVLGQANCVFDGATTALNYVVASTTAAGSCHDAGSAYPVGVEVIGKVLETGGAGTHPMSLFLADVAAASTGSGGGKGTTITVNGSALASTRADFDNATPAAGAGYLNVAWSKDALTPTNISAKVPISGNTSTLGSVSGALTNGHGICADASGNLADCGAAPLGAHNLLSASHGDTTVGAAVAGDVIYADATPKWTKLAKGADGQVLTLASGLPSWATPSTYMSNPMTTLGDLIYGAAAGVPARLAGNTTKTRMFALSVGDGADAAAPSWDTVTKSDVGLGNVENTALSTWAGSSNITTLGTIAAQTTFTKGVVVTPATLTVSSGSIATNAALSTHFRVTLDNTCPCTLSNPTNSADGMKVVWEIIQDGTGSRTLTLDSDFAFGTDIASITLTTTASKRDFLGAFYNSTTGKWYVTSFVKGY